MSLNEIPADQDGVRWRFLLHNTITRPDSSFTSLLSACSACIVFLHLLRKSRRNAVRPTVMAGHVPAASRDRFSLRMAGTCPAMTVEQHAAGIFTLSWCPRAGWGTALQFLAFLMRGALQSMKSRLSA
jgi:hypothetical protein